MPVAFTKDNRVHIGPKMEMRVVALGLDNAGKTSILFKLKQDEFVSTITTIGKLAYCPTIYLTINIYDNSNFRGQQILIGSLFLQILTNVFGAMKYV